MLARKHARNRTGEVAWLKHFKSIPAFLTVRRPVYRQRFLTACDQILSERGHGAELPEVRKNLAHDESGKIETHLLRVGTKAEI